MPPRKRTNDIQQAVNDVGIALKSLLSAYEACPSPVTQAIHARVFNHLRASLGVIEEQCGRVVTLSAVTSFSLDGPEPDFVAPSGAIPSQRVVQAVEKAPPVRAVQAPTPVAVPIGRLSKHADDPRAGEKFFDVPAPPPRPEPDDNDVGFISE
jgi:hypothetical protein